MYCKLTLAQPWKVQLCQKFEERALYNLSQKTYLSEGHASEDRDSTTLHIPIQGMYQTTHLKILAVESPN